jgi:hypothetical protein
MKKKSKPEAMPKHISIYVGPLKRPKWKKKTCEGQKKSKEPDSAQSVIQDEMAAPQHVRAAPLARALRATATATASVPVPVPVPAGIKSQGTSRRALLGLSEPQLRQLAIDLGQVPDPMRPTGFVWFGYLACLPLPYPTLILPAQQSYRGKQLHDLLYKSRAKQIQEFNHGGCYQLGPSIFVHARHLLALLLPATQSTDKKLLGSF